MAGKIITLNKDEVIKVVELARGFLMTFETNYICYGLFKGIEKLKKIEIDSNHSSSYNILKMNIVTLAFFMKIISNLMGMLGLVVMILQQESLE